MASSEKTVLGFSKWVQGDKPGMEDFNADNKRMEELFYTKEEVKALIKEELKSYYSLKAENRILMPEGADLDDYIEMGNVYAAGSNENAATMKNNPFPNYSFVLTVDGAILSSYVMQTVRRYDNGATAVRIRNLTSGSKWNNWSYYLPKA